VGLEKLVKPEKPKKLCRKQAWKNWKKVLV